MADPAHKETDVLIEKCEKRMKREYQKAVREIQETLKEHLAAFDQKKQGRLDALDAGEITEQEYNNWYIGQVMTGKRWKDLENQITDDLLNVNAIARSIANGYKPEVYALNINYATYDVEHKGLLDTSFTLYDKQTVERLVRDEPKLLPSPGKKVAKEIAEGKATKWNMRSLESCMIQSILQGESTDKAAKRISSELCTRNYRDSVRYARTAMTSAQNAGRYDGYRRARDMGVDLKIEWQATLDQRTRHEHRMLHGQRREIDEPFEVDGIKIMYPADAGPGSSDIPQSMIWNCRCTLLSWVKGFEGETVKSSPKMGDMTFEEWQQANPMTKEEQDEWIKAGKPSLKQTKDTSEKVLVKQTKNASKKPAVKKAKDTTTKDISAKDTTAKDVPAKDATVKDIPVKDISEKTIEKQPKDDIIEKEQQPPKSLEHFKAYEEDWRSSHYGDLTAEERELIRQKFQEMFDRGEYHMAIEPSTLSKVLDSGRFKNQQEVGTSNGIYDPDLRKRVAKQLFGADVDKMVPRDFEKYGYLGYSDFAIDASSPYIGNYGSVTVRFKKQTLKDRVTYTHGDSLAGAGGGFLIAGQDGDHVSISGIEDYKIQEVLSFLTGPNADMIYNPNKVAQATNSEYIELQYHGDLLVTDVDSVCFNGVVREELVERLKSLGIRVFKSEWGAVGEI